MDLFSNFLFLHILFLFSLFKKLHSMWLKTSCNFPLLRFGAPPFSVSILARYLQWNTIITFNRNSVFLLENENLNNYQLAVKPSDWFDTHTVCKQSASLSWQRSANYVIDSTCNSICERRTRFVLQYQDAFAFQASVLLFCVSLVWRSKKNPAALVKAMIPAVVIFCYVF